MAKCVTGVNVTMSCVSFSRLKELGLKKTKIENTIIQFGSKCEYVVMGYLPFLKQLVECDSVPKQDYDSSFFLVVNLCLRGRVTFSFLPIRSVCTALRCS